MTDTQDGEAANLWLRYEKKQGRSGETWRRRRIKEMARALIKERTLNGPRKAFRPFKTLILTDEQKRAIRRTREFRLFRALVTDDGRTLCLSNECRAVGHGNVRIEIAASHPVTADRAKFSATVDGGGKVVEAKTLDDEAIKAKADRARAG